jgi:hypothetical protein
MGVLVFCEAGEYGGFFFEVEGFGLKGFVWLAGGRFLGG